MVHADAAREYAAELREFTEKGIEAATALANVRPEGSVRGDIAVQANHR